MDLIPAAPCGCKSQSRHLAKPAGLFLFWFMLLYLGKRIRSSHVFDLPRLALLFSTRILFLAAQLDSAPLLASPLFYHPSLFLPSATAFVLLFVCLLFAAVPTQTTNSRGLLSSVPCLGSPIRQEVSVNNDCLGQLRALTATSLSIGKGVELKETEAHRQVREGDPVSLSWLAVYNHRFAPGVPCSGDLTTGHCGHRAARLALLLARPASDCTVILILALTPRRVVHGL